MLERLQPVLKIICLGMAALVLYQIARLAQRTDPLRNLTLSTASFSPVVSSFQTNKVETNSVTPQVSGAKDTNALPSQAAGPKPIAISSRQQPAASQIADLLKAHRFEAAFREQRLGCSQDRRAAAVGVADPRSVGERGHRDGSLQLAGHQVS